jgi:HEAT repeat protein
LQVVPGREPAQALVAALRRLQGIPRLGVMASLGLRRESIAVGPLARLISHADRPTAGAALGALGDIGSVEAARVLKVYLEREPVALRVEAALAALACAQQLHRAGKVREAAALVGALDGPGLPDHVLKSAKRERGIAK